MPSVFTSKKILIGIFIYILMISLLQGQQLNVGMLKSQQQTETNQIPYTENIHEFKSNKYNQRLQMVVGCWLLSKEYLDLHKSNYLFFKDLKLKEIATLKLVKECMKKINRKDSIMKITSLVGKNLQPVKNYKDLVDKQRIEDIFTEISQLTIVNYHHYQPINKEHFISTSQNKFEQNEIKGKESSEIDDLNPVDEKQKDMKDSENSLYELSEFDTFLIELIKKYNQEFHKLITSKQGLRGKVEQELKKRQKYYFGFIPASSFTHSVLLVTISLSMVFCCTCYKYYKRRASQTEEKRKKRLGEGDQNGHSHSHSKQKQSRKVTKMTQLTMKRKAK